MPTVCFNLVGRPASLWRLGLLSVLFVGVTHDSARSQISFESPWTYDAEGIVREALVTDMTGDGIDDFVTIRRHRSVRFPARVVVHVATESEGHAVEVTRALSIQPRAVAAGDFNEDGHRDLVIAGPDRIEVLVGDSTGALELVGSVAGVTDPTELVAGDWNLDDHLDIALLDEEDMGRLVWTLGDGSGGFSGLSAEPLAANGVFLTVGRFDDDEDADLAVGVSSSVIAYRSVRGFGLEKMASSEVGRVFVGTAQSIDVTLDGLSDLVVPTLGGVSISSGDGKGRFEEIQWVRGSQSYDSAVVLDTDGDGSLDLVAVSEESGFFVHLGEGGRFRENADLETRLVRGQPNAVGRIPIHGVDRLGLILSFRESVLVMRSESFAQLRFPQAFEQPNSTAGLLSGDFNGDGYDDLIVNRISVNGDRIFVLLNDRRGGFGENLVPVGHRNPSRPVLGNLDGDLASDLAVVTGAPNSDVTILRGDGAGGFEPYAFVPFDEPITTLHLSSRSPDEPADVYVSTYTGTSSRFWIVRNHGEGVFVPREVEFEDSDPRRGWNHLVIADLNGDGLRDLVLPFYGVQPNQVSEVPGFVAVYLGRADGGYDQKPDLVQMRHPAVVRVVDFDHDGTSDILVADEGSVLYCEPDHCSNEEPGALRLFRGDGTGTFEHVGDLAAGGHPQSLIIEDFDRDGFEDFALSNLHDYVAIVRGTEQGPRDARKFYLADMNAYPTRGRGLVSLDADRDGSPDLGWGDKHVEILRNDSLRADVCRRGTVDASNGEPVDVVWVNDSAGSATDRVVRVEGGKSLTVRVSLPPTRDDRSPGSARFVLYAWSRGPDRDTIERLPEGVGDLCLPTPTRGGSPAPQRIWNNLGRTAVFGIANRPSTPAPTTLVIPTEGLGPRTVFLQGVIVDPSSPSGRVSVTNGVEVRITK